MVSVLLTGEKKKKKKKQVAFTVWRLCTSKSKTHTHTHTHTHKRKSSLFMILGFELTDATSRRGLGDIDSHFQLVMLGIQPRGLGVLPQELKNRTF